ncbi:A24 family peptidase C-terminal domain-containing protein [Methanococcoides methylutens]|uniref:A24 family peptidase C-terminal domain-containing protein n=1 Tax=Methanococcoides methylutens TaxID=2226 RepID=UPI004044C81A
MIELLKVLVCAPFLIYACYSDIKTRRVTNSLWPKMLGAGAIFMIYDAFRYGIPYIKWTAISFILIFTFVYILFYMNAFGGADAKVLMVISLILPIYPAMDLFGQQLPIYGVPPLNLFTFSVFGNSVILTIIVPIGLFLYNLTQPSLKDTLKRPHYMFVGYRCPVSKIDKPHIRLMESFDEVENGVSKKFTTAGTKLDEDTISKIQKYAEKGLIDERVWVTPGLPFMIPITAGFIAAVIYGDLIFQITLNFLL